MFIGIVITSLITLLAVIVSTIIYIVALVIDEPDDPALLGIDSHEFSLTPVLSPSDIVTGDNSNITADSVSEYHDPCDCFERDEPSSYEGAITTSSLLADERLPLGYQTACSTDQTLPLCEMISSAIDSPKSPRVSESLLAPKSPALPIEEREKELEADQQLFGGQTERLGAKESESAPKTWHSAAPPVQKNHIASELGIASSKKLFDDFDSKEMQFGGTGLHWCKTKKSLEKLLKLGMPIELVNRRQETALHVAIRRRKLQVLIGLLCHGANVERRTEGGETPLIMACKMNDIFACQLLLVFDADYNAKDSLGNSARHYAASICDKHKIQQQRQQQQVPPNAAHLILAMLNEIGAKRCGAECDSVERHEKCVVAAAELDADKREHLISSTGQTSIESLPTCRTTKRRQSQFACTDGCTQNGTYNGNSYNRWSNYKLESLYKRYMFSDLIDTLKKHQAVDRSQQQLKQSPQSRLLCFDGGGLRGVIICQILIEMEKYLDKPMLSYFDWIGGTSVGAFMACALSLGTSLRDLRRICFGVKDEVFSGHKPYNAKFLERVLRRTCGSLTRMSDIKGAQIALTTVIADRDPCQLVLFRNYKSPSRLLELCGYQADKLNCMSGQAFVSKRTAAAVEANILPPSDTNPSSLDASTGRKQSIDSPTIGRIAKHAAAVEELRKSLSPTDSVGREDSTKIEHVLDEHEEDPLVWQVARASAAAPFFFKPYGPYLDGGLISNNPTLDMLSEFHSYHKVREFLARRYRLKQLSNIPPEVRLELDSYLTRQLNVVVSLGTGRGRVLGRQNMLDFGTIASGFAAVFSPVELARSIRAARELFKKLMQQSCNTDDHVLDRAQAWCASLKVPYFRINPPLASIFSIDDKRDEQLINALWQTKLYMKSMSTQLLELSVILDGAKQTKTAAENQLGERTYLTL